MRRKKGKVVFYQGQKVRIFFRNIAFFTKKIAQSFYIFETQTKTRGLFSRNTTCFAMNHALFG